LTVALQSVLKAFESQATTPLTLRLIIDTTGERAFGVLMAFLCLPFLSPLPLPAVSVPFGLALLLLGAQIAIRKHRPWLPVWLLERRLPTKTTLSILRFVAKLFRPLERLIRPRLLFMQNPVAMVVVGVALALDGILLSLPLPIAFTNAIPAWMALIKILGITEEDGVSLLVGSIMTFAAVAGIVVAIVLGVTRL